jgi:hypothetical protein
MKQTQKFALSLVLIALVSTTLSMAVGASPLMVAGVLFAIGAVIGAAKAFGATIPNLTPSGSLKGDGFTISDTTYAGEAAGQFIVRAITGNDTVQGGHVYVKDGIKKKFTIPRWDADYEDLIQDRMATPISKGEQVVSSRTLTPADYMIYMEFNPRDFEDHWYAQQLNPTLIDRTLPASVESVVIQQVLKRHDRYVNKMIWAGDTTTAGIYKYFDGFVKKATDDANTVDLAGGAVLTSTLAANILDEVVKIYNLIPASLKYDPSMKLFLSYDLYDAYAKALIAQANKGNDYESMQLNIKYRGLPVVRIADFPANKMMFAKGTSGMDSNLWVGMNSVEDAKLEMNKVQNNSELFYVKMLCKLDVQFGFTQEVVNYAS